MSLVLNRLYLLALKILRDDEMGFPPSLADVHALADGIIKAPEVLRDLTQEQQLRMQRIMDRMEKAGSASSNTMKKFSELASSITGNLK